jgi:hypothetical protein
MEMQQTHYYTTGTATLPWKCNMVHRSCYQGKPNMSQYNSIKINHNKIGGEVVAWIYLSQYGLTTDSCQDYIEISGYVRGAEFLD